MRMHILAASVLVAAVLSPWAASVARAQDHTNHGTPAATMACCADHKMAVTPATAVTQAAPATMPCCADHKAPAAPAPAAASVPCCDDKAKAAPAKPMACCDDHAKKDDSEKKPAPQMAAACCDGNDAAVAAAGLGLAGTPAVHPFGRDGAAHGLPAVR